MTAVAGLALAGCSSESDPAPTTSRTPATSPSSSVTSSSPSPSTTKPGPTPSSAVSIPPEARAHTKAGAKAFVRFYIEQINKAWQTPNADLLRPLVDPECISCKGFIGDAEKLERKGLQFESAPLTTREIINLGKDGMGNERLRVIVRQNRVEVVSKKTGASDGHQAAMDDAYTVSIYWKNGQWHIYDSA